MLEKTLKNVCALLRIQEYIVRDPATGSPEHRLSVHALEQASCLLYASFLGDALPHFKVSQMIQCRCLIEISFSSHCIFASTPVHLSICPSLLSLMSVIQDACNSGSLSATLCCIMHEYALCCLTVDAMCVLRFWHTCCVCLSGVA